MYPHTYMYPHIKIHIYTHRYTVVFVHCEVPYNYEIDIRIVVCRSSDVYFERQEEPSC